MRRRRPASLRRQAHPDAIAAALARSDFELVASYVLDVAVEAVNMLGASTIDDALAILEREQETQNG